MPTQEQIAAACQREANATARLEAELNLPPPPPQAAAAVPPNFEAAFPLNSPPVLSHTGPDEAIHSRIGDRVSLSHVGPVNCVAIKDPYTKSACLAVVPEEIDLWKMLLVGFPSGNKRMTYVQMEALKDNWDFVYNGYSNAPFIKTNYPHNSVSWRWGDEADQVALVLQYIRCSLVECSDIWWYMSYESEYNKDRVKVEEMYGTRKDVDEFYIWRDNHVLREMYKYGWYIDYWMENGLMCDPYTRNVIDQDNWVLFSSPEPIVNEHDKVTICHHTMSEKNPWIEQVMI